MTKTAYFKDAIPRILYEYNFSDDHRSINCKEFITRYKPNLRKEHSKAFSHMLMREKEGQFINSKKEQTKKVDSIQKHRMY